MYVMVKSINGKNVCNPLYGTLYDFDRLYFVKHDKMYEYQLCTIKANGAYR